MTMSLMNDGIDPSNMTSDSGIDAILVGMSTAFPPVHHTMERPATFGCLACKWSPAVILAGISTPFPPPSTQVVSTNGIPAIGLCTAALAAGGMCYEWVIK